MSGSSTDPSLHELDKRMTTHEAICAERYASLEKRLEAGARIMRELRVWIYAIVALLALGEGTVLEVAKRVFLNVH